MSTQVPYPLSLNENSLATHNSSESLIVDSLGLEKFESSLASSLPVSSSLCTAEADTSSSLEPLEGPNKSTLEPAAKLVPPLSSSPTESTASLPEDKTNNDVHKSDSTEDNLSVKAEQEPGSTLTTEKPVAAVSPSISIEFVDVSESTSSILQSESAELSQTVESKSADFSQDSTIDSAVASNSSSMIMDGTGESLDGVIAVEPRERPAVVKSNLTQELLEAGNRSSSTLMEQPYHSPSGSPSDTSPMSFSLSQGDSNDIGFTFSCSPSPYFDSVLESASSSSSVVRSIFPNLFNLRLN